MQYHKNNFNTYKNYVPWIFMYVFFIKTGRFSSMLKAIVENLNPLAVGDKERSCVKNTTVRSISVNQ